MGNGKNLKRQFSKESPQTYFYLACTGQNNEYKQLKLLTSILKNDS